MVNTPTQDQPGQPFWDQNLGQWVYPQQTSQPVWDPQTNQWMLPATAQQPAMYWHEASGQWYFAPEIPAEGSQPAAEVAAAPEAAPTPEPEPTPESGSTDSPTTEAAAPAATVLEDATVILPHEETVTARENSAASAAPAPLPASAPVVPGPSETVVPEPPSSAATNLEPAPPVSAPEPTTPIPVPVSAASPPPTATYATPAANYATPAPAAAYQASASQVAVPSAAAAPFSVPQQNGFVFSWSRIVVGSLIALIGVFMVIGLGNPWLSASVIEDVSKVDPNITVTNQLEACTSNYSLKPNGTIETAITPQECETAYPGRYGKKAQAATKRENLPAKPLEFTHAKDPLPYGSNAGLIMLQVLGAFAVVIGIVHIVRPGKITTVAVFVVSILTSILGIGEIFRFLTQYREEIVHLAKNLPEGSSAEFNLLLPLFFPTICGLLLIVLAIVALFTAKKRNAGA